MEQKVGYRILALGMAGVLLAGCGKQGAPQPDTVQSEISFQKIMDIGDLSESSNLSEDGVTVKVGGTKTMEFEHLSVAVTFPDRWSTADGSLEYPYIHGNELDRAFQFEAGEIDKELFDGKIGDSMEEDGVQKKLKAYIKDDVTNEDWEDGGSQYVWQDTAYETVTVNEQKYVKVTGVTKTKKDIGDAHVGYFTVVNGVVLKFLFESEAATIDTATQSVLDGIMKSVTYTYK